MKIYKYANIQYTCRKNINVKNVRVCKESKECVDVNVNELCMKNVNE